MNPDMVNDTNDVSEKLYVITLTFLQEAPDPLSAQMMVLRSEGTMPRSISAEEVTSE